LLILLETFQEWIMIGDFHLQKAEQYPSSS
jgi:hypothetical protein